MGRKARQRVCYVIDSPGASVGGHRLGINSLAVDRDNVILYSGGRDGILCAWDLNLDLSGRPDANVNPLSGPGSGSRHRTQTQAHMHWINDIALAHGNSAVVSASSDLTVKLWLPHAAEADKVHLVGEHSDYVKCVAAPPSDTAATWVASGGLDGKICLWDLSRAGKTVEIDTRGEEVPEKGAVYALRVGHGVVAGGGPELILRLWDPRTGLRVANFVGHTKSIRAILLDDGSDIMLTGSADRTVKVWSLRGGRCMYTLTMHNESVWALHSDDPRLRLFHSADRAGLVAKTDLRGALDDLVQRDCLSATVTQENDGVRKLVACAGHLWTATGNSCINRWADIDTTTTIASSEESPVHDWPDKSAESLSASRSPTLAASISSSRSPSRSPHPFYLASAPNGDKPHQGAIRSQSFVRPSKESLAAGHTASDRGIDLQPSVEIVASAGLEPVNRMPVETIAGQYGLLKASLLKDRRHALTLDTDGKVALWDLIKCAHVRTFDRGSPEEVERNLQQPDMAVSSWCSVDTSSGSLMVTLDPLTCFDAEVYADELELDEADEFRDDQRINLGKWVLRYLFANLITEEIKRDEAYRLQLARDGGDRRGGPASFFIRRPTPSPMQTPEFRFSSWNEGADSPLATPLVMPRGNGSAYPPASPMVIGPVTPTTSKLTGILEGVARMSSPNDKRRPSTNARSLADGEDYFGLPTAISVNSFDWAARSATTPTTTVEPSSVGSETPTSALDGAEDKENGEREREKEKSPSTPFGKKFRMGNPFGSRKLARSQSGSKSTTSQTEKPSTAVVEEKAAVGPSELTEDSESSASKREREREHERAIEDRFLGVTYRIRNDYHRQLAVLTSRGLAHSSSSVHVTTMSDPAAVAAASLATSEVDKAMLETRIAPSLPNDTPLLSLPASVKVVMKEETSGGMAIVYSGTVGSTGHDADTIEQRGSGWLAELLLLNQQPLKEPVKISFVLLPWRKGPPVVPIAVEGINRLNANRMLRVRKILAYVAERTEPAYDALRPEDYIELYCNNTELNPSMSLAAIKANVWKAGGDVVIYYKTSGRRDILGGTDSGSGSGPGPDPGSGPPDPDPDLCSDENTAARGEVSPSINSTAQPDVPTRRGVTGEPAGHGLAHR